MEEPETAPTLGVRRRLAAAGALVGGVTAGLVAVMSVRGDLGRVDRGTDVIGMAGGDGSQALVASVAMHADVPLVCIPAGTRNHFALDLGLERDDVETDRVHTASRPARP